MADFHLEERRICPTRIKVIGVGGGGCNAVRTMIEDGVEGAEFVVMNTDLQALEDSPCENRLQLGERVTRGLGAGALPEVGRKAAQEDVTRIGEFVQNADMIFITAGLGGGTGTGAAPIVAQVAKEAGALTVAVVTKPFSHEGRPRIRAAEEGLANLAPQVDAYIVIPNDKLLDLDPHLSSAEAFRRADSVVATCVRGIIEIIQRCGRINVDFADVRTILEGGGPCLMGQGEARGEGRAIEAMRTAICSPFIDESALRGATRLLVYFVGAKLVEQRDAMDFLRQQLQADDDARAIVGVADSPDDNLMRVTVIATGFRQDDDHATGGPRAVAAQPHVVAHPRPSQFPVVVPGAIPAGAQRQRPSAVPPPRRAATQAGGGSRPSQVPLIQSASVSDAIFKVPTFVRFPFASADGQDPENG